MEPSPDIVGIGQFADGSFLGYDVKVGGSFLLVGSAGSGKSATLFTLVGAALLRGEPVVVCRPRIHMGEYDEFKGFPGFELHEGVTAVTARLKKLATDSSGARTLLVIDDYPTLAATDAGGSRYAEPFQRQVESFWGRPNIDMAVSTQRSSRELLGEKWRGNSTPILIGRVPSSQAYALFGHKSETFPEFAMRMPSSESNGPGRGVASRPGGVLEPVELWSRWR